MKKLLTLAVLAAVAASCTQSEVEDVKQSNEYIGIASATVNNMVLTRAGEASPLTEGSLGLFVATDGADIFKVDNMRWNHSESGWTSYANLAYEGNGKQTAYAYHPYQFDAASTTFNFTVDGFMWNNKDLLWWTSNGELTDKTLDIDFDHALSKLVINLNKNEEVQGEDIGEVTIGGTKVSGTVDLKTQTWNTEGNDAANLSAVEQGDIPTPDYDHTVWALLIPQTTDELTVSVEVGSKIYTWTASTVQEFKPGNAYTLNLTIGREVTAIGNVTVSEWTENDAENGNADYVPDYLTGEDLRTYMEEQLASNIDITVNLKPNASFADFLIIRNALKAADIEDGTINLTITGATFVPDRVFGSFFVEGAGEATNELYTINLPDAIGIGEAAFTGINMLTSASAPKVQIIENDAFMNCISLTQIHFPQVKKIEWVAFSGCRRLSSIELPEIEVIDIGAFEMTDITSVDLPKAVSVSDRVFNENNLLSNVNLPLAQSLGAITFRKCPALTTVIAPKANYIGAFLFDGCTSLETVELTTEEEITMNENAWNSEESEGMAINEQVNLVLNKNKESEVEGNVWKGVTFKSITFKE